MLFGRNRSKRLFRKTASVLNGRFAKIAVERSRTVKTGFYFGFNLLGLILFATACPAVAAQSVTLANPQAAVGAPPDSCHPALTGEGGPVAWQVLLVHNR